jgi:hypothetical protein
MDADQFFNGAHPYLAKITRLAPIINTTRKAWGVRLERASEIEVRHSAPLQRFFRCPWKLVLYEYIDTKFIVLTLPECSTL